MPETVIRYTEDVEGIRADQLTGGFFEGWPNRPNPLTRLALLHQSDHVVLALDASTGDVVGFVTALTDGVLSAYVPLLEVLPPYRGRGIGTELVRRLLATLDGLYMVDLLSDPELQPFYAQFGFQPATGMAHRNYVAQGGRLPRRSQPD